MSANALAIDFGTTACKASVIAIDGSVLGSGLTRLPVLFGDDGAAEQDPEQVWTLTLDACRSAIAEAGADAGCAADRLPITERSRASESTRNWPLATTWSPSASPSTTSSWSPRSAPSFTSRGSKEPLSFRTMATARVPVRMTASAGSTRRDDEGPAT